MKKQIVCGVAETSMISGSHLRSERAKEALISLLVG